MQFYILLYPVSCVANVLFNVIDKNRDAATFIYHPVLDKEASRILVIVFNRDH